ncbi:hypothetical protein HU200_048822 [Digitaria exilis]|uniref:NB-ARC domain-containing protein n=1 Tax=Digitaria exilis TaxID=1010633 RepID=A0A835ECK7_9POAL|nr:hypothetical protein HU200_048822 [Digitaria exilis]
MGRPTKKLLRWLAPLDETGKGLRFISVVGPAGIGKTTLAMELCKQLSCEPSEGHYNFQCKVMAKASRRANRNELLLRDIISQISDPAPAHSDKPQSMKLELLVSHASELLQDKRYFILIDDMYLRRKSEWEKIKAAFPDNNFGSRILITTRFPSIAWWCCSNSGGFVYMMKPLNKKDSQKLLLLKAFDSVDVSLPDDVKPFVNEFLMRCEGIPLFIVGMADCLKKQLQKQQHHNEQLQQEEDAKDGENPRARICGEEQPPQLPEQIQKALASTFDDIPYELRPLSLYMSMFPYGYRFDKDQLIMKWLCEDLTDDWDEWRNVDHADAEKYFSQLVDRNVLTMVAPSYKSDQDETEACQWHVNYFMQQFLASKAAETGFAFTSATVKLGEGHGNKIRVGRRISIHHQDPCLPSPFDIIDLYQTRSLAVSGRVSRIPLYKFSFVVLDLEGCDSLNDDDLLQVCRSKMFFLQYLSIRNTGVSKLPDEIEELCSLMMLDIRGTKIRQLPKQIAGLRSTLRTLLLGSDKEMRNAVEPATILPLDMLLLHRLSTLATIDLSEYSASFLEALGAMENLRVLAITLFSQQCSDRAYREALLSSIRKLKWLKSLTIHCGLGCSMEYLKALHDPPQDLEILKVTLGRFASVPEWICKLKYLSFIQITIFKQGTDDLKILSDLPKLHFLILGLDFIPEEAIVIESVGFLELQRFSVDCPVPWLTFRTGAMPKLTFLQIKFYAENSQTSVPSGIGSLTSLSEVALCYANSPNIKVTVRTMREQIAKHGNQIELFINGDQDCKVQVDDEEVANTVGTHGGMDVKTTRTDIQSEMKIGMDFGIEVQSINVNMRTTTDIQSEIEVEAEAESEA